MRASAAVVLLAIGCAAARSEGADAPEPEVVQEVGASLPAGLYFRNGYIHCSGCAEPRWAVVAGVFADAEAASAAMLDARERAPAELGFPLAVHTDELALVDRGREGIAVVVGWFEHEAEARTQAGSDLEVVELLDREGAWEIESAAYEDGNHSKRRFVVQLEGDGPIDAFDGAAIQAAEERLSSQTWDSYAEYLQKREAIMSQLPATCRIDATRLFVADDTRYDVDYILGSRYQWQPVACDDGRPAWVRQSDTRCDAIVLPTADGPILEQVVLVECDVAKHERWLWVGHHRRRDPNLAQPPSGHC